MTARIIELDELDQRRRDAIDAAFVRAVYDATIIAEQQRIGELPIPTPSAKDYKLLRHVDAHRLGLDPVEIRDSLVDAGIPRGTSVELPPNVIDLMAWLEASIDRAPRYPDA